MATITRKDVQEAAYSWNLSELQAITMMQTAAAKIGDNDTLEALCAIKAEVIGL